MNRSRKPVGSAIAGLPGAIIGVIIGFLINFASA
jgi:hypothetical protein